MKNQHDQPESDLPTELSNPARRALVGAGYVQLEQFTRLSEAEVLQLHGMGPKGIDAIRRALEARGLSFADRKKSRQRMRSSDLSMNKGEMAPPF